MPRSVFQLPGRISAASLRAKQLSSLTGGLFGALKLMVAMRRDPQALQSVSYRGHPVTFRPNDEQALKEVLVDDEYGFLSERLASLQAPRILDIGSHIGTFAMWLASVSPQAQITCVEADPATYGVLTANLASHAIGGQALHRAASSSDDELMRFSNFGPSMSHRVDNLGEIEVTSISLRSLLTQAGGRVELAKIDVEGSEEALICEDADALGGIDALVIELHPALCDVDRVRTTLASSYPVIIEIAGRRSTKPLLYCHGDIEKLA